MEMDVNDMRTNFFYVLIALGIFSVLYYSWIDSPRLSLNGTLPKVISDWTDRNENDNFRTAVPFFFISILIGIVLTIKKEPIKSWKAAFISLVILIFLAELGQLFLPLRMFDWGDIAWAIIASFIGLFIVNTIAKKCFR